MQEIKIDITQRNEKNQVPIPEGCRVKPQQRVICYNDDLRVQAIIIERGKQLMAHMDWNTVEFNTKGFYQKVNTENYQYEIILSRSNFNIPYR